MKKSCELCKSPARMYCKSDQASLCWDCDFKVHSANFIVARHSRSLLCQVCQSPSPWSASGAKLGSMVSACERCVADMDVARGGNVGDVGGEEDEMEFDYHGDNYIDGGNEGAESDYDEEEDGSNPVVPWPSSAPASPSATSSPTSSEESSSIRFCCGDRDSLTTPFSLKRSRQDSEGDLGHQISRQNNNMAVGLSDGEDEIPADYPRPLECRRIEPASTHPVRSSSPLGDLCRRFPPGRLRRRL
ncbi:hypothetical protein Ancab_010962 [Ancistrocladus abbreviatus]